MAVDGHGGNAAEISADGYVGGNRQIKCERIGIGHLPRRNDDAGHAAKRERLVGGRVDVAIAGAGGAGRQRDVRRIDRHGIRPISIGETHADQFPANARADELA